MTQFLPFLQAWPPTQQVQCGSGCSDWPFWDAPCGMFTLVTLVTLPATACCRSHKPPMIWQIYDGPLEISTVGCNEQTGLLVRQRKKTDPTCVCKQHPSSTQLIHKEARSKDVCTVGPKGHSEVSLFEQIRPV